MRASDVQQDTRLPGSGTPAFTPAYPRLRDALAIHLKRKIELTFGHVRGTQARDD